MNPGTARRCRAICEWIEHYEEEHRYAPSVRELSRHLNTTVSNAHRILSEMKQEGLVDWVAGSNRTLHVK